MKAKLPGNEGERLKVLAGYAIMGTPPEPDLDAITALAAVICGTPISLISLVGKTQAWVKALTGYGSFGEILREASFCAHNLEGTDLLVVPDASLDPRFADNPFVTGEPRIRFYASAPIVTRDGQTLGALCVVDRVPRQLEEGQLQALRVLSRQVMTALELRRELAERDRRVAELRMLEACIGRLNDMMLITEADPIGEPGPRITYVNDAFLQRTGYARAEVMGRSPRFLQGPKTDRPTLDRIRAALAAQAPIREVVLNYTKSGEEYWVELDITPLKDSGGRVTHYGAVQRDITTRMRDEAALKENTLRLEASEIEYRMLFANHPQPMWIIDLETLGFLEVNAAARRHYGYSAEEFRGMKVLDMRTPEDAAELARHPERLNSDSTRVVRSRHLRKDGTPLEMEVTSSRIVFDGRPARLAMMVDITQRVQVERAAERANRALQMLSRCNELLIRVDDEPRLLAAICQVAVEIGDVRLAWVGYASQDEGQMIVPQALAGYNHGYVEQLDLSWSEGCATADRPCARTIRQAQTIVIPDLAASATFRPWLEAARERGYAGLVTLPLKDGGRAFGVLALYSAEARDLPAEEVKLLQELADNLAAGILNIRARLERRRTTEAVLAMSRGVSLSSGQQFFEQLARHLVEALGAEVGLIGEHLPGSPGTIRTLGVVIGGKTEPNFDYALDGTPCANLQGADVWLEGNGVCTRYPQVPLLAELKIEAYLAVNLVDTAGAKIGLMCVEFRQPITQPDFPISILKIFAARAAAELQRLRDAAQTREQADMLDKAQDAILVLTLDHRITFWNKSCERVYGWTAREAVGRSVFGLLNAEEAGFQPAMDHLLKTGEWAGELTQRRKDGQKLAVEIRLTLVRDAAGAPKSILAINTDITERRRLEQQFLRAQRMESIGTLAGGIAHDLNNLLAPITMGVDLLSRLEKNPKSLAILESMQRSAKRGADLVKQVLSFARGVEGVRSAQQIEPILREIESIVANTFPRNINLETQIPRDLWSIVADPTQLNQVLLNLCVNARDAMPEGGRLELAAYNIEVDAQIASLNRALTPGRYVVLQVTDNGSGIPPAIIDRIFEPFFTTKEIGKGTGLGLSTVMSIVRSHGGTVNVYSEPNKGTVFKIYLPAQANPDADNRQGGELEKFPRGNGELILVVDDESSILDMARQALETFGYRVATAGDGAEAVALYAQRKDEIAAVLTDMMMPVMDGLALIAALRRIKPDVLIVAASGLNANGNLTRALNLGVHHFLAKPYAVEAMLQAFRKALAHPAK
jgi:PAS domain S-box-containing protein